MMMASSSDIALWLKSLSNIFINSTTTKGSCGDSSNNVGENASYFKLWPMGEKSFTANTAVSTVEYSGGGSSEVPQPVSFDRNNNNTNQQTESSNGGNDKQSDYNDSLKRLEDRNTSLISNPSCACQTQSSEEAQRNKQPVATAAVKMHPKNGSSLKPCDIPANEPSPKPSPKQKSIKSSKVIDAIIEVIRQQLSTRFEPYVLHRKHSFPINPFMSITIKRAKLSGLSNVVKAESDGLIRCVGKNRYSVDCTVAIENLQCDADYVIKFGQQWHQRPCMRNQTLSVNIEQCLIYVQILVNTATKAISFDRFSLISQRQFQFKTKAFSVISCENMFATLLQRKFKRYFAANLLELENSIRVQLNRSTWFNYDVIVNETALHKMFDCFQ